MAQSVIKKASRSGRFLYKPVTSDAFDIATNGVQWVNIEAPSIDGYTAIQIVGYLLSSNSLSVFSIGNAGQQQTWPAVSCAVRNMASYTIGNATVTVTWLYIRND